MKKLANFIVEKRILLLVFMLALTVVCGLLIPQVGINTDMTKYLPDDSSMKMGMDVMEEEFPELEETYTIRVMFTDLSEGEQSAIEERLAALPYVDSVDYDEDSPDYNKDNHTLYKVGTLYDFDTEQELALEKAIEEEFASYEMVFTRDVVGKTNISPLLLTLAVAMAMVILFAMCASWAEPLLFLFSILVAVVINMGTNIFLGSISDITSSIAAILQMVLSMDYSIILLNRYRQEIDKTDSKYDAMKNALTYAFSSIASSAVTTIVGLVVLVFMRFKIGQDLGLVLAKGVFISMICTFTLLPVLILLFDKLIKKTAKKVLHIKMDAISAFSYRFRHVIAVVLVVLFVGSYFLQGNTQIAYTLEDPDPIAEVFPATNTVLVLFDNQDEEKITEIAEHLEENEHVTSVTSVSTTLDKQYTSAELADEIDALSGDFDFDTEMDIDSDLLDILYYYRYRNGEVGDISTADFLRFLADDVAENETFSDRLDDEILDRLDLLSTFSDKEELTKPKTAAEISDLFEMEEEDITNLMVYYFGDHGGVETGTMTLPAFVRFIQDDVMTDEDFADLFDADTLDMIDQLATLTDTGEISTPKSADQVADTLDMDADDVELLFLYYFGKNGAADNLELTFPAFADLLLDEVLEDSRFDDAIDSDTREDMDKLSVFADPAQVQAKKDSAALADTLGMDADMAELLFLLYFADHGAVDDKTMQVPVFSSLLVNDILNDDRFDDAFDDETREQIELLGTFGNEKKFRREYTSSQFAELLGVNSRMADLLYSFYYADTGEVEPGALTLQEFVRFLKKDIADNPLFSSMFPSSQKRQIETLSTFTDPDILLQPYTAAQMAELLGDMGIDRSMIEIVYTMYHSPGVTAMTLPQFIDLLADNVLAAGSPFAGMVDPAVAAQVKGFQQLIRAEEGGPYTAPQLAGLTGLSMSTVQEIMNNATPTLGYSTSAPDMTLMDFLQLSLGLAQDPYYAALIGGQNISQLTTMYGMLQASASGQSFTAADLSAFLGMDESLISMLFQLSGGGGSGQTMTLSDFIDFLVANFGPMLGEQADSLTMLKALKDSSLSNALLTDREMAELTGMDSSMIAPLYIYHTTLYDRYRGPGVELYDIVEYIARDMTGSGIGGEELSDLIGMKNLMDGAISGQTYTPDDLAGLIGMEPDMLKVMYAYQIDKYVNTSGWRLSLEELVDYVLDDLTGGDFGDTLEEDDLEDLEMSRTLMESTLSGRRFTPAALAELLDMEPDMLRLLYAYHMNLYGDTSGWRISLRELVDFILEDLTEDEDFGDTFDDATLDDLRMLRDIMAGSVAGTAYTPEAMADLLDMDTELPTQLYLLNISRHGSTRDWKLSLQTFIHFITDEVLTDPDLADQIDADDTDLLDGARRIVDAVIDGHSYSYAGMTQLFDGMSDELTDDNMKLLYVYYFSGIDSDPAWTFSLLDLFNYLVDDILPDPLFADLFDEDVKQTLYDTKDDLDEGILQLRGPNFSRMVIATTFPGESDETYAFLGNMISEFDQGLKGNYYLVGNSPMNYEMSQSFGGEMALISALTAISIFIVILLTFRNFLIPTILVLIIQTGVYITVSTIGLQGYSIYYLALLIVQCILMGATIDYGILFTNYYVENRKHLGVKEALTAAYNGSIHTILTSGLIIIVVTGILGQLFENPTVGQICETISKGALCATLLIVFVLPGVLAVFDRWITKSKKQKKPKEDG
ncbi:MAG: MMPL family transporter [Oscillospiraceae bacterium]